VSKARLDRFNLYVQCFYWLTGLSNNSLYISLVAINPSFRRTAFYETDVDDFVPSEGKWHGASTTAFFEADESSEIASYEYN